MNDVQSDWRLKKTIFLTLVSSKIALKYNAQLVQLKNALQKNFFQGNTMKSTHLVAHKSSENYKPF